MDSKWECSLFSSVKSLSCVQLFLTPSTAARQDSLSITRAYPRSYPLSQLYHPAISSSVVTFSSCLQSFAAPGAFPMSQFFSSGGQSIGALASPSVFPVNIHWNIFFKIDWFALLALQGTCRSLLQHHSSKASILQHSVFSIVQLSYPYMTTGKNIALTRQTFVSKVMSLLFNVLSWS